MAPKKAPATANGDAPPFKWDAPTDVKLLTLTQGRYVKPEEYPRLLEAFPGTNIGGIRNRVGKLRTEQRKLYEELGWDTPEGIPSGKAAASASTSTSTPSGAPKTSLKTTRKRNADDKDSNEEDFGAPSKKATKKRAKKAAWEAIKKADDETEESGEGLYVKIEPDLELDEDVDGPEGEVVFGSEA